MRPLALPAADDFESWLERCPLPAGSLREYAVLRTPEGFKVSCGWFVSAEVAPSHAGAATRAPVSAKGALRAEDRPPPINRPPPSEPACGAVGGGGGGGGGVAPSSEAETVAWVEAALKGGGGSAAETSTLQRAEAALEGGDSGAAAPADPPNASVSAATASTVQQALKAATAPPPARDSMRDRAPDPGTLERLKLAISAAETSSQPLPGPPGSQPLPALPSMSDDDCDPARAVHGTHAPALEA
jgi:hypothetical protein